MIARADCEALFREAVADCDPSPRVARALVKLGERHAIGLAIGKAALAMARGAGPIGRGLVVTNADDGRGAPSGWRVMVAAHPVPDERSLEAGDAAIDLIASARPDDRVVALISGGASALCERLEPRVTLAQLRADIAGLAARGAPIEELNARRKELSAIKGGKLARMCDAPITTLVCSDVVGDDPTIVGSGPTIADRPGDRVEVIARLFDFANAVDDAIETREIGGPHVPTTFVAPMTGDVAQVADELFAAGFWPTHVAWGEPTVHVPADHGEGGRAQQLALELAKRFRGKDVAALVAGSDGIDGPPPRGRPWPAGAYVDGTTWDAIARAGIDPQRALDRRDAGTALHAVGALFVTGPTGINHADVAIFR